MCKALSFRRTGNQDVVDVHIHKIEAMENFINGTLKSLSSIPKTKRHAQKLEQAERSANDGLRNIICVERNLMICMDKINLGENGFAME